MRLVVLGSGDAFGSGGRLQTSFHLDPGDGSGAILIDCGVTSLIGMARAGLDPNGVAAIVISHLHGDHFGGLPWWLLHAQYISRRTRPLVVAGPPGIEARFRLATEALYPGALAVERRFEMKFLELVAGTSESVCDAIVTPFEVLHPSGAPSYAFRLWLGSASDARVVAFSGDTEWTEALIDAARGADLFITECYQFEQPVRYHLSWGEIRRELPRFTSRRIMLTHMGAEMLANRAAISDPRIVLAEDGLVLEF